jgi:hypothetical protein
MSIWNGSIAFVVGLLSLLLVSQTTKVLAASSTVCREHLGDVSDPNGSGGWILLNDRSRPVLCISGSLEGIQSPSLVKAVSAHEVLDLVVRSTGGPVDVWLDLAENLVDRLQTLFVDEACISSCANYLLPVAKTVVATGNSLIVWHGGPNNETHETLAGAGVDEAIAYDVLARRTNALYARAGINPHILSYTEQPPDFLKASRVMGAEASTTPVSGYALSPRRLATCFGFRNLEGMWHAGDDEAVYALGRRRSSNLALLESPRDDDGSSACLRGPS